jgi:hypothetical protein
VTLPPATPDGLTVKVWSADRPSQAARSAA